MAGSVNGTPTFALQPSAEQVALQSNYITNFDFLNQYLPDTYEKEFERYGNRTIASFLRMVGAEMPSNSDLIKWAEQGRLHTKYVNCASAGDATDDTATITVSDTIPGGGAIAIRVGQTVVISDNAGGGENKAIVTAVDTSAGTFDVAYYQCTVISNTIGTIKSYIYLTKKQPIIRGAKGVCCSVVMAAFIVEVSGVCGCS